MYIAGSCEAGPSLKKNMSTHEESSKKAMTAGGSRLAIFCCGEFSLKINDVNLYINHKKAYEMLAYLAVNRGRPMNKYNISSHLWEASDEICAMDSLYKTYASLKKEIHHAGFCPIGSITNKLFLDQEQVYCDLWEFEQLYADKNLTNWEKAERLYKGELFGGEAYSWLVEYEGRYEIMYYEIVEYLLSYHREKHSAEKVRYYENRLRLLGME